MPVQAKARYTIVLHGRNKINVKKRMIEVTGFKWIKAELSSSISVHPTKAFPRKKIVYANARNIMHYTRKVRVRKEKYESL